MVLRRYDWDQTYSASDYRKLMLSYSGTQMMDEDDRVGLLDEMESFINREFGVRSLDPLSSPSPPPSSPQADRPG